MTLKPVMTDKLFSQFVESAAEQTKTLFVNRWLLMPDTEVFIGADPENLDHTKAILEQFWDEVNQSVAEIRKMGKYSQQDFADRFAIPKRTVQNWEARKNCPTYLKLLLAKEVGLDIHRYFVKPTADIIVSIFGISRVICEATKQREYSCIAGIDGIYRMDLDEQLVPGDWQLDGDDNATSLPNRKLVRIELPEECHEEPLYICSRYSTDDGHQNHVLVYCKEAHICGKGESWEDAIDAAIRSGIILSVPGKDRKRHEQMAKIVAISPIYGAKLPDDGWTTP